MNKPQKLVFIVITQRGVYILVNLRGKWWSGKSEGQEKRKEKGLRLETGEIEKGKGGMRKKIEKGRKIWNLEELTKF